MFVDVEGFSDGRRTDPDRSVVRAALYAALQGAFTGSGVPWGGDACYVEDRGDGALILVAPSVPKRRLVTAVPPALADALREHNQGACPQARIRLRIALHAGEISYDDRGVIGTAINVTARLVDAAPLKQALRLSKGTVALIASEWFFQEVIRNDREGAAAYWRVQVSVKETHGTAWICLPDGPRRTGLVLLPPALDGLLRAQEQVAEDFPYRLLSGPQPDLSEVYVERPAEKRTEQRPRSRTDGKGDLDSSGQDAGDQDGEMPVVRSVLELLRTERHAIVVGEPGMGKSTLLRHLAGTAATWWLRAQADTDPGDGPCGPAVPVWLAASALVGGPLEETLAAGVTAELGLGLDRAIPPEVFTLPPGDGVDWLIMVDGLDEILDAGDRAAVIRALAQRLSRSPGHRFLITSRPLPDLELAPLRVLGTGEWRLRPFDRQDLEGFARRWFTARRHAGAELEARRFLDQVERARLQAITRIPLLATITVVVYEQGRDQALPMRLAALYAEFLRYLLLVRQETVQTRRELRERLALYTTREGELADWLFGNLQALLEYLATEFLSATDTRLADLAVAWVAEHCPALPQLVPDHTGRVIDLLRGTGVLLQRGDDLRFLHHSFAEYLAAGPAARCLDPQAWRRQLLDLATRNHALFTVARWTDERAGQDPTTLVEPLLERHEDDDLLAAAAVLAYGIPVAPAVETAIIDALFVRAQGILRGEEFFAALSTLPGRETVRAGLATLMTATKEPPAIRIAAARTHASMAGVGPAVTALTDLAQDPMVRAGKRVEAARVLFDLGETTVAYQVLARLARDPAVPAEMRVRAAEQLAPQGHRATAREVVATIAHDQAADGHDRVRAARALGTLDPAAAIQVLTRIIDDPATTPLPRIWAAGDLAKLGRTDAAIEILATVVFDPGTADVRHPMAREWLADIGRAGAGVVPGNTRHSATDTLDRLIVAQELARLGEPGLARAVLTLLGRAWLSPSNQVRAARIRVDIGDRDAGISQLIGLGYRRTDAAARLNAASELNLLGEERHAENVIKHLARGIHLSSSTRITAAIYLAGRGRRTEAVRVLDRMLRRWYSTLYTRAQAAQALADLGERDRAIAVLRRMARHRLASPFTRVTVAERLAELGEHDMAIAVLRRMTGRRFGIVALPFARLNAAIALAGLGERDLAVQFITQQARKRRTRLYAASRLTEAGERETAKQILIDVINDRRTRPDDRLYAARTISSEWGRTLAVELLTAVARNQDIGAAKRVRAAADLAKIANRELATTILKSMTNGHPINVRMRATLKLLQWKALRRS